MSRRAIELARALLWTAGMTRSRLDTLSSTASLLSLGALLALSGCVMDHDYELDEYDVGEFDVHDVGEVNKIIVGGVDTQIGLVPWQVSLQSANGNHFCGGSIIAPEWIVTAAHCVVGGAPGRIVAGTSRLSTANQGQIVTPAEVIVAPGYVDVEQGKDIALIKLATPLTLNGTTVKAIRPVTPKDAAAQVDAPTVLAKVSGWGTLTSGGNIPDQLQSVEVPILTLQQANAAYGTTLTPDQLPAGILGVGGKDSCQGDSGGPFVVPNGNDFLLAGVVSWGNGCALPDFPGLYARVSSFTGWMDGYVGGPPTANAGADGFAQSGQTVQLNGTASQDAGFGEIATYSWRQVSGTPVTLQGSDAATASFVAPGGVETLEFELTVSDSAGNKATDVTTVNLGTAAPTPGQGGQPGAGGDPSAPGSADLVGGCSAGSGNASGLFGMLFLLGLCLVRRRR